MKLVILGPQGSGKGVQAERIAARWNIPHISVGDLLRDEITRKSVIGNKIASALNAGKLVPDGITDELVRKRLEQPDAEPGWILDGYPRDADQAEFLDMLNEPDTVLVIDVSEKVSLERITNRRICLKCHAVYGSTIRPKKEGICDKCGSKLVHREDDKPTILKRRLKRYHQDTEPLIEYYKPRGIVRKVDGSGSADAVFKQILAELD
ncbi:MAG TPA: adenylate kinase [Candidatus Binatia bacterium]|nr:adenylate kinase [Candidatus Binatia bacterium]